MSERSNKKSEFSDNLLEKIKNLFNKQTSASDTDRRINNELVTKLKTLENAYNNQVKLPTPNYDETIPKNLGLTQKKYQPESDDELLELANLELQPAYQTKVNKLESDTESKLDKLTDKKEKAQSTLVSSHSDLSNKMHELAEKQQSKMIKQGLIHSSINAEGKREISEYGSTMFEKINTAYDTLYNALLAEEESVNKNYQTALREYDLKYALDLEKKLATLEQKREKRLEEINTYNRKIAEQEEAYQKKRAELIAEQEKKHKMLEDLLGETQGASTAVYGINPEKQAELDMRYQLALDTYSKMDKNTAILLISENYQSLYSALGEQNFDKLYKAIYGN